MGQRPRTLTNGVFFGGAVEHAFGESTGIRIMAQNYEYNCKKLMKANVSSRMTKVFKDKFILLMEEKICTTLYIMGDSPYQLVSRIPSVNTRYSSVHCNHMQSWYSCCPEFLQQTRAESPPVFYPQGLTFWKSSALRPMATGVRVLEGLLLNSCQHKMIHLWIYAVHSGLKSLLAIFGVGVEPCHNSRFVVSLRWEHGDS